MEITSGTACINMITWLGASSIELMCFLFFQVAPSTENSFGAFCFALMHTFWPLLSHKFLCPLLIPPHPPLLPSLQDEQSAMLMLKRHMILKQAVDDYADSIQKLSDRAQKMFTEDHPDGFVLL